MVNKLLSAPRNIATYVAHLAKNDNSGFLKNDLSSLFSKRVTSPESRKLINNFIQRAGANSGTLLGGTTQGLINPNLGLEKEEGNGFLNRALNIVAGAAGGRFAGGRAGARLGVLAPDLLQKGVGRVVTNLRSIDTFGDSADLAATNKPGLRQLVRAIVKDKPLYNIKPEDYGRDILYRRMFNLEPRAETADFLKRKVPGVWEYNPSNPYAKKELDSLGTAWTREAPPSDGVITADKYKKYLDDIINNEQYAAHARTPQGFSVKSNGKFEAKLDFARNPNETYDKPENVLRGFLSMFGTPEKLVGVAPSAASIVKNIPGAALRDKGVAAIVNKSLAKRIAAKEDMSEDLISRMLSANGPEKLYSPYIQRNLLAAGMKNKNFDALQHALNMLSVKGTGNSFNTRKQFNIGTKNTSAWGHNIDYLQGPSGRLRPRINSSKRTRENLAFVSDISLKEKSDILKDILAQDKDFALLYKTEPYIKKEIDDMVRKEISNRLLKRRTFVEPVRFNKADINNYF
jgi:hypothetical protein